MKIISALFVTVVGLSAVAQEQVGAAGSGGEADETILRIYRESCDSCHGPGVNGAPRPGVQADWQPRLINGVEGLYLSAIEGLLPRMPERGLCFDCSDAQLQSVVDFMLSRPAVE